MDKQLKEIFTQIECNKDEILNDYSVNIEGVIELYRKNKIGIVDNYIELFINNKVISKPYMTSDLNLILGSLLKVNLYDVCEDETIEDYLVRNHLDVWEENEKIYNLKDGRILYVKADVEKIRSDLHTFFKEGRFQTEVENKSALISNIEEILYPIFLRANGENIDIFDYLNEKNQEDLFMKGLDLNTFTADVINNNILVYNSAKSFVSWYIADSLEELNLINDIMEKVNKENIKKYDSTEQCIIHECIRGVYTFENYVFFCMGENN